jgi:glutamine amidotransferase
MIASSNYYNQEFCSVVKKGNIYGCQFHPEKSGSKGLKLLENFIRLTNKPSHR